MEVRSRLTGVRGVGLPFTDECAALLSGRPDFAELMNHGIELGRERGWRYVELRDLPKGCQFEASGSFHHHELDLRRRKGELFAGLEGSVRRAIRKAEASGLTVEVTNHNEGVEQYYRLHALTRKRQGIPPQPLKFFRKISEHIVQPGKGFVVLAKAGGKAVAGAVFFLFGSNGIYKFGASDMRFQQCRPNHLVMWTAICELLGRETKVLSFGRTSPGNQGLRRFKLSWGAEERSINYLRYDLRRNQPVPASDRSFGLHTLLFRALPVWANEKLGKVLYRHLA